MQKAEKAASSKASRTVKKKAVKPAKHRSAKVKPSPKPQAPPRKQAKPKFFYVPVKETGSGPTRWCTYRACLPTVAVPVSLLSEARSSGGTVVQFLDGSLMHKLTLLPVMPKIF